MFNKFTEKFVSGCSYHLQGENGAGKTSLLKQLSGIAILESGHILWNGAVIDQNDEEFVLNRLFVGHKNAVHGDLTVIENLKFLSKVNGERVNVQLQDAIDQCDLGGYENVPCKYLSLGQARRVAIARLFVESALIWILDEPINGLDYNGIELFTRLVETHTADGGLVIFTSHQLLSLPNQQYITLSKS